MKLNMWTPGLRTILREQAEPGSGGTPTDDGQTSPDPAPNDPPPADPPTPEPAAPDFSWVPEDFKTDDGYDFEKFRENHDELVAFKAQQEERLSQVPEKAEDYDLSIPEDLDFSNIEGLPEGFTVQPLADDEDFKPLFNEFAGLLHEIGAPKEASNKAMGLIAKYEAQKFAKLMKEGQAELGKIDNAKERIATVNKTLQKRLPENEAAALDSVITSADALRAFEKLLSPGSFGTHAADPAPEPEGDYLAERYPSSKK